MAIISHVEIPVTDLERAMGFYAGVFQLTFAPIKTLHGSRMAHFPYTPGQDGASVALAEGEIYHPTQAGAVVYFTVPDLDAVLARAHEARSRLLFPKTDAGDGIWVAEIEDSEGNRIALQMLP